VSNYYELLEVPRDASVAAIRQAYVRLARERHPDRFTDPEENKRAQEVFTQITEAFNTLTNEKSRREYDARLAQPQVAVPERIAKDAYDQALAHIEGRRYHEAVELLRTAVHYQQGEARYHAALGHALSRNPHWIREAVHEIEQAIQLQPQRAAFHAALAEVLMGQGLRLRARKAAEMALRLDPEDRTARAVLEAAGPEDGGDDQGGLRGLIRRK
jgi:curved DNA-binding protein CbpA